MNDLSGPIGLCIKARACSFGYENALKMLKKSKSFLVLVSDDASEGSKKRMADKCKSYDTEIAILDIRETLNTLRVKNDVKIISINDENFKKLFDKRLKGET